MIQKDRATINNLIDQYTEDLIKMDFENLLTDFDQIKTKSSSRNKENIETGLSGYLLILIELYRVNKSSEILNKISNTKKIILKLCKTHTSNNYALYTGRSGAIYAFIKLFYITKDEKTLDECIEILKSNGLNHYIQSLNTPIYFHNGLAGTLLVLLKLYELKNDEFLNEKINEIILKIISKSTFDENGVSWKNSIQNGEPNPCGFAFGAAGIFYTLNKIKNKKSSLLNTYLNNIKNYIDSNWNEIDCIWENLEIEIFDKESFQYYYDKFNINPNFLMDIPRGKDLSWYSGIIGISISNPKKEFNLSKFFSILREKKLDEYYPKQLVGFGYYLIENLNNEENKEQVNDLIEEITNYLLIYITSKKRDMRGGLMYGELGIILYFIKYQYPNNNHIDILFPFNEKFNTALDTKTIDKQIFEICSSDFQKTISLLNFIDKDTFRNVDVFKRNELIEYIEKIMLTYKESKFYESLIDCFEYEKKIKAFLKEEVSRKIYFKDLFNKKMTLDKLNVDIEKIKHSIIKKADDYLVIKTHWNWNLPIEIVSKNLESQKSDYKYLLKNEKIYNLTIDSMIFDSFSEQTTINNVYTQIKFICTNMAENDLIQFIKSSGSRDKKQFLDRLEFLVTHRVMHFLYEGLLDFI